MSGIDAGVAAAEHREVYPLAALVGPDEQRPGGVRDDLGVAQVPPDEPAGLAGHPHAGHLGADHVRVAEHEGHDLHHQRRHPEPLHSEQQGPWLGGGGEQDRGHHAQRPLRQDVPATEQAGLADRQPEDVDAWAVGHERQQHREEDERHLDDHPAQYRHRRHLGDARPPRRAAGHRRRTPRRRRAEWRPRRARRSGRPPACSAAAAGGPPCPSGGTACGCGRRSPACRPLLPRRRTAYATPTGDQEGDAHARDTGQPAGDPARRRPRRSRSPRTASRRGRGPSRPCRIPRRRRPC